MRLGRCRRRLPRRLRDLRAGGAAGPCRRRKPGRPVRRSRRRRGRGRGDGGWRVRAAGRMPVERSVAGHASAAKEIALIANPVDERPGRRIIQPQMYADARRWSERTGRPAASSVAQGRPGSLQRHGASACISVHLRLKSLCFLAPARGREAEPGPLPLDPPPPPCNRVRNKSERNERPGCQSSSCAATKPSSSSGSIIASRPCVRPGAATGLRPCRPAPESSPLPLSGQ